MSISLRRRNPKRIVLGVTTAQSLRLLSGFPEFLTECDWEVHVVSSAGSNHLPNGWTHHDIAMVRDPSPWHDLIALLRWTALLARIRPGIVVVGTPKAGLLGILAAAITFVPERVYLLRGLRSSTERGMAKIVLNGIETVTMKAATIVQAVSLSLAEEVAFLGLTKAGKLHVVGSGSSNGVVLPSFEEVNTPTGTRRAELNIADRLTIGFVGRLHRDKGVDTLLHAFLELSKRFDVQLLLIGPEEPTGYLHTALEGFPTSVADRILQTGPLPDPSPYYRAMDILCLPTKREGFPNVILEAAAHGVPTVASNVTGCVDAVTDGETGRLFPVGNHAALTSVLGQLLDDPQQRTNLGDAAHANVTQNFSRCMIWSETEIFYYSRISNR